MKKVFNVCICLFLVASLLGCEEESFNETPVSAFEVSSVEVVPLEVVSITNKGKGEFYTFFSGEDGAVFGQEGSIGVPANAQGNLDFSYTQSGVFNAVFLVSSYIDGQIVTDHSSLQITVTDSINAIDRIRFDFPLNEALTQFYQVDRVGLDGSQQYAVEVVPGEETNLTIPVFNAAKYGLVGFSSLPFYPTISSVSENITFDIDGLFAEFVSGSTRVIHAGSNGYMPVAYTLTSESGESREYQICAVEIPEFTNFTVDNAPNVTNRIHPSRDDFFFTTVPYYRGTDLSSVTPAFSFTFNDETSASLDGEVLVSVSSTVDLTSDRTFLLEFRKSQYEDIFNYSASSYAKAVETPEFESFSINGVNGVITKDESSIGTFLVDIELPSTTDPSELEALVPEFSLFSDDVVVSVGTGTLEQEQSSGVNALDMSAFSSVGDRVAYTLRSTSFYDHVTDSITYENAFGGVESTVKVGVTIAE